MLKFIGKIILTSVLSGLFALVYWNLVVYYGFPVINFISWKFDGESAYNYLFFEIFLIFFCLFLFMFYIINISKNRKSRGDCWYYIACSLKRE